MKLLVMFRFSHSWLFVMIEATGSVPGTPQRIGLNASPKTIPASSMAVPSGTAPKRSSAKAQSSSGVPILNKLDVIPVIPGPIRGQSKQLSPERKLV